MSSTDPARSELQEEARSVETSADRLRDLLRQDSSLGPIIASNSSASPALLNELALKYPAEVLANPMIPLRGRDSGGVYGVFSLPALVSLCLVCRPDQHADLLEETRQRLLVGMAELRDEVEGSLSLVWLYQQSFTLCPEDCDNLIDQPLDFMLEVRHQMYADGPFPITGIPESSDAHSPSRASERTQLGDFLNAVRGNSLLQYIDSSEISREDGGSEDVTIEAEYLPVNLRVEGSTLYKDNDLLLHFVPTYNGAVSAIEFEDGSLTVPVEFIEELDLQYKIALSELSNMGKLNNLVGLELKPDGLTPCDWPTRLAALLIP